jgi:hypothetical protein
MQFAHPWGLLEIMSTTEQWRKEYKGAYFVVLESEFKKENTCTGSTAPFNTLKVRLTATCMQQGVFNF